MATLNNKSLEQLKEEINNLNTPTSVSIFGDTNDLSLLDEDKKEIKKINFKVLKDADIILDKSFEEYKKLLEEKKIEGLEEVLLSNYKELLNLQISLIFEKSIELLEKNSSDDEIIKSKIMDFIEKFKNKIATMNEYIKQKTNQESKKQQNQQPQNQQQNENVEEEEFITTEDTEEEPEVILEKQYKTLEEIKKDIKTNLIENLNKNKETSKYNILTTFDKKLQNELKKIQGGDKYGFVDIIKPIKENNTYSVNLLNNINKTKIQDLIKNGYELYGKKVNITSNKYNEKNILDIDENSLNIQDLKKEDIPKDSNNKNLINIQQGGRGISFEYVILIEKFKK